MEINGVTIDNTYAEAFPTWVCRVIITAVTKDWAEKAATEATGFATSSIGCPCEAGIEGFVPASETPDGRTSGKHILHDLSLRKRSPSRSTKATLRLIFGPSGSGKSTFLKCMAMLTIPDKGDIFLRDQCLTKPGVNLNNARARIGFVFQHIYLFRHLTALGNVELALRRVLKLSKNEARERAFEALSEVKVEEWAHHYPAQLSGGQQQRVAIARALVNNAAIILADEPTGNLDTKTSAEIMELFTRLNEEFNITVILVTHEQDIRCAHVQRLLDRDFVAPR